MAKIRFLGGAGTVTGSKYLVTTEHSNVLIDCGLFQGLKRLRLMNRAPLAVNPADLDAVILTHAHIDHSGYLPVVAKSGFKGPVFCSKATSDLCRILLPDAGYLQEEEARYANRKGFSKHHPALPLFTQEDAQRSLTLLRSVDWHKRIEVARGVWAEFFHAGHILGGSMIRLHLEHENRSILFTGDLGRSNDPIVRAPESRPGSDYLVVESTYGDRRHVDADPAAELTDIVNRTIARGGVVIIPAFAVGRAQTIIYLLHRLRQAKHIPDVPVYLNSPMARRVTDLLSVHADEHRLNAGECQDLYDSVVIVNSAEDSKELNRKKEPMIIISASGMATGGRVIHHLKTYMTDERNTVLFAGYQAAGTRGAAMVGGAEMIKIHGDYYPVRAEVANLDTLSAHSDYEEIMAWLSTGPSSGRRGAPERVFITHGEPSAAAALRSRIEERFGWSCEVPLLGSETEI